MAEKLRLGIIADCACPTGFATVTHNIIRQLTATGEFEVQVIGINFDGKPNEYSKEFSVWPARLGGDLLGIGLIPEFFKQFKPDVFFMFQDFWNIPVYIAQCPPEATGLVTYYPVDSPNVKGQFMLPMAAVAQNIVYTQFGVQESMRAAKEAWGQVKTHALNQQRDILQQFQIQVATPTDPFGRSAPIMKSIAVSAHQLKQLTRPEAYKVVPHGIDMSAFYPLPSKHSARKMLGLPVKGFYIGNVNRNQSRKRQDLCIRAFAKFAQSHADARLLLNCVAVDGQGWDLNQLAEYYEVTDKVIFAHSLFENNIATIEQLNMIYNACDVHVNTSGGEGHGLTSWESAATGCPQIVPDWSATKELWEGSGLLIKICSVRHEPAMINTMQCVIDTDHLVELLSECYESPALRESVGQKCLAVTQRPEYKWDVVGKQFADIFKASVGKTPAVAPVALTPKGVVELKKYIQGAPPVVEEVEV